MKYILENKNIQISADTYGGELHNLLLKKDNIEYLWNGDEAYWKYHSPILFPIVGKVLNGKYTVDNKEYELPQHGFARTTEFEMVEKDENHIVFELKWSEETLKIYPYKFSLRLSYQLLDNGVKVGYSVKNLDDKEIYFSIGGHPAFMCPRFDNETFEDYYFEFDKLENAGIMELDSDKGFFKRTTKEFFNNSNKFDLNLELFKYDALVFSNLKSTKLSLKSHKNNRELTMDFTGFPYIAVWTKSTGAPFICIEPWYGHADYEDFKGEFKDKAGVQSLHISEEFKAEYSLFVV